MALFQCNFTSIALNRPVNINVIIPTVAFGETEQPGASHVVKDKFPVLYLLHGIGQDAYSWLTCSSVTRYAEENHIAVVMPSGEKSHYVNTQQHGDYMDYISRELPEFVEAMFPVSSRWEDRYIAGLSMGGNGSLLNALTYPERYCAVGAFSAPIGVNPERKPEMPNFDDLKKDVSLVTEGLRDEFSAVALSDKVHREGRPFPRIFLACGDKDFGFAKNKLYAAYLQERGAEGAWVERPGLGHEWRLWDPILEEFIRWLPRTDAYAGKRRAI